MKCEVNREKIFYVLSYIGLLILFIIQWCPDMLGDILAVLTIIICVMNMMKSRRNIIMLILHFQLLYYNYSIVFSRYLYTVKEYTDFYINTTDTVMLVGIFCIFSFEFCMLLCNDKITQFIPSKLYSKRPNQLISMGLLTIVVAIGIVGFDWSAYGQRGAISSYYEYIGILLIFGLYYAGNKKNKLIGYGYSVLIVGLIIQGLAYGERVAALQFIIIWAIFFLGGRLTIKSILGFGVLGLILMAAIGSFRDSYSISSFNMMSVLNNLMDRMLTFNGADLGYYCSLTFVMVADKVTITQRFHLFWEFLLSIFVGNSYEAYLPEFTRHYYMHWYGGFYPLYFCFYGGLPCSIAVSYLWCKFIKKCNLRQSNNKSSFWLLLLVYLTTIAARWYIYSPLNAFRPVLLFTVIYYLLHYVDNYIRR